jgi:hypothetical protein
MKNDLQGSVLNIVLELFSIKLLLVNFGFENANNDLGN